MSSSCLPEKAISGTTNRSRLSRSSGLARAKTASARFRLLSTSATWGANCRHPILIVALNYATDCLGEEKLNGRNKTSRPIPPRDDQMRFASLKVKQGEVRPSAHRHEGVDTLRMVGR